MHRFPKSCTSPLQLWSADSRHLCRQCKNHISPTCIHNVTREELAFLDQQPVFYSRPRSSILSFLDHCFVHRRRQETSRTSYICSRVVRRSLYDSKIGRWTSCSTHGINNIQVAYWEMQPGLYFEDLKCFTSHNQLTVHEKKGLPTAILEVGLKGLKQVCEYFALVMATMFGKRLEVDWRFSETVKCMFDECKVRGEVD